LRGFWERSRTLLQFLGGILLVSSHQN
jgi:hypothetical protein